MTRDSKEYGLMFPIIFSIFIVLFLAIIVFFSVKHQNKLDKSKEDCRELGGYIETLYKNPTIFCWNREGNILYFRR